MRLITLVKRLLNNLFGVISPKLHQAVVQAMRKVWRDHPPAGSNTWSQDNIAKVARAWPGAMPGISVISNRASICHMDGKGQKEWYDLLVTAGTYTECWFRFPDLDLHLKYLPGTAIALNG